MRCGSYKSLSHDAEKQTRLSALFAVVSITIFVAIIGRSIVDFVATDRSSDVDN